jgi:O-antigen ligase
MVLCTVFSLFSFISRTALYAFVLVLPVTLILIRKSARYLVVFTLLLALFFSPFLSTLQEASRRMFAFQNLDADSSARERNILFEEGISAIKQNWFIGDYVGQLRYGSLGAYIHNYLSLWRQFGFIPFFSFIILLGYLLTQSIRCFSKAQSYIRYPSENAFLIMGGCFCLVEILAARSYNSPFIWFFIGMAVKLTGQNVPRAAINSAS